MSEPPFRLVYTPQGRTTIAQAAKKHPHKHKKVVNALKRLAENGPDHPGLHSHKYTSLEGPHGEAVWESYAENHTPGAWRIWWCYGPDPDTLMVVMVGAHP